jgi:hypothetical protein
VPLDDDLTAMPRFEMARHIGIEHGEKSHGHWLIPGGLSA